MKIKFLPSTDMLEYTVILALGNIMSFQGPCLLPWLAFNDHYCTLYICEINFVLSQILLVCDSQVIFLCLSSLSK